MKRAMQKIRLATQPNLSSGPVVNCFEVREGFRSQDPLAEMMDRLNDAFGANSYARVDLALPLGCPFSLFLVRGFPKGDEIPCMIASLAVSRELAQALAEELDGSEVLEFPVEPRRHSADANP